MILGPHAGRFQLLRAIDQMRKQQLKASLSLLWVLSPWAGAATLYQSADSQINAKLQGAVGVFHSDESYGQTGVRKPGGSDWQEAVLQYGMDFKHSTHNYGQLYGGLDWVSSATFGDGDAAGWTLGDERTTKLENAYLGWKSAALFPLLGQDGLDLSLGRQTVVIGDGFLMSGDALNLGKGLLDGEVNRGGAYYLTGRKAFDQTAIVRWGGDRGWRGDLMWLKSDNPAQAKPELAVTTLEHVSDPGTVGLTHIKVIDTDDRLAEQLYPERRGMKLSSLRAQGNAGVSNLFLAGEHAWEDKASGDESAWYMEAGWSFAELPAKPVINYRYSRFSEGYDPLFYGNGRALGTWFQGEVAGNYAGPFNSNVAVQHIGIKAAVSDTLNIGALLYSFDTLDTRLGNRDGRELDLYAEWAIDPHWALLPLVGMYKPERSAEENGSQLGGAQRNVYAQVLLAWTF
ncbi:Alginate export domain-containing protein [Pseudomonas mediterranea]